MLRLFWDLENRQERPLRLTKTRETCPLRALQLERWTIGLQSSVLFNRVSLFVGKKLRDYQNSGFNIISYILMTLLLIVLTVFTFSAINLGLFKIDSSLFSFNSKPTFFTLLYYSFNRFFYSSIKEIIPTMPISQVVSMVESFLTVIIAVIFVSLLFSWGSQKHKEELNEVIKTIEQEGEKMEGMIKDEYRFKSIEDAMMELRRLKSSLASFLYKITETLK
jgi:hypothetical protein